ncbi:hypothetical protein KFK09_003994 [Dendrobium nobile]|uniref:Uncharacterized protein n=1 Tax=Dendrobium nobile TaxID=94219 RepID=A0A8T3C4J0_DENNO|nr:hypothetical protein KFK09_003994 [Dendrobium nobile]
MTQVIFEMGYILSCVFISSSSFFHLHFILSFSMNFLDPPGLNIQMKRNSSLKEVFSFLFGY